MYSQLSNVADKSYLEMIRDIPFIYDLGKAAFELKFHAELSKVVNHYDSLTPAEESEAGQILMGKITNPAVFNWQPVCNEMVMGCDVTVPVGTVDDFRLVLNSCFEEARRAKARAVFYQYTVTGNFKTHFGGAKVSSKERTRTNPIKHSVKADCFSSRWEYAHVLWQKQSC